MAARELLYIKNIRVGASAFIAISSCEDGVWVTKSCIMTSLVVNIQYHIVKYIGIICLWVSFMLRFLFYFCCALIDGDNAAMTTARHLALVPKA